MTLTNIDLGILLPAFIAGLLVLATHVPLGQQVLARGIIFIDLAIAQVAGLGVIVADSVGWEPQGWRVQVAACSAAIAGALVLTWTEKRWPEVQEAMIGVLFVLAASVELLLLANNPHGGEHLKDLLVGQILWVTPVSLIPVAILYGLALALWFTVGQRIGQIGFYLLFAVVVTQSVQLVGIYLVFTSLIVPALGARRYRKNQQLPIAYLIGVLGYLSGLLASALFDLPTGAVIVCSLVGVLLITMTLGYGNVEKNYRQIS
jgi:zinc/manganese transport system permease protein